VDLYWIAAGLMVFFATVVQTVTGAGLGLMAGPVLLLAMGNVDAIRVAVLLNLALSVALLPGEIKHVPTRELRWLSLGAAVGLPIGIAALLHMDLLTLKLVAGVAVTLGGIQMCIRSSPAGTSAFHRLLPVSGLVSGAMTGALAIPGPVALWGLSAGTLDVQQVRAALRAYFVLAYSATVVAYWATGSTWAPVLEASLWMSGPLVAGGFLGVYIKRRYSGEWLRKAFIILVLLMGSALLVQVVHSYLGDKI
jgi:uncharacterized protein